MQRSAVVRAAPNAAGAGEVAADGAEGAGSPGKSSGDVLCCGIVHVWGRAWCTIYSLPACERPQASAHVLELAFFDSLVFLAVATVGLTYGREAFCSPAVLIQPCRFLARTHPC